MLSCQSLVHATDCTEFATHTAGVAVIIFRKTVIADGFGCFGIQGAGELCIPVKNSAGVCHFVINISGMRDSLGNICCMRCNLGSNDTLFYIFYVRQSQVLGRCYIAKESSTVHGSYSTTDSSCNMIISRGNIGY